MGESDEPPASQPDPSVLERLDLEGFTRWVFLHGDRGLLSVLLLGGVLAVTLALIDAGVVTPAEGEHVRNLAAALIGGMLPFITVVLAINQLILSEEFGTTGAFYERLEETREFRERIENHTGTRPSPAEPGEFLRLLIRAKRRTAMGLQNVCSDGSEALRSDVDEFVADTSTLDAEAVDTLDGATFGSFTVVGVIIRYNDPWQLQVVRQLRERHRRELSEIAERQLDRLEALLQDIHVGRQYFKSVYMQQELADLSKILLYVGFPTLLGGAFVVVGYDNLLALELHPYVYWAVVSATITALFSPFAVLLLYTLRIATIARRTAADFGPFVLQKAVPGEEKGTLEETGGLE